MINRKIIPPGQPTWQGPFEYYADRSQISRKIDLVDIHTKYAHDVKLIEAVKYSQRLRSDRCRYRGVPLAWNVTRRLAAALA